MRLEAQLSYALIGLVQATGSAGGLDSAFCYYVAAAQYNVRTIAFPRAVRE